MPYEKTTWKSRDLITASKMNNIENGIETAGEDKFVRYDVAQNLTETQKTRARENIGAAGEGGGGSSGGGSVFEMVCLSSPYDPDPHYESVDSAETILAAFKAGKHTVLHFEKCVSYSCKESYATIAGYDCPDQEHSFQEHIVVTPEVSALGGYISIDSTIVKNDKLYVPIYVD